MANSSFKNIFLKFFEFTPTLDQDNLINSLENFLFSPTQNVFVLKGYAGVGKTTVIGAFIKTLSSFGLQSVLLAPTGRAAKVLSAYSKRRSFTIHKYIYFTHRNDPDFQIKLKENKSQYTIYIVDESSMIGQYSDNGFAQRCLLDDLMYYVKQGQECKIIFIGDVAQLPPVKESYSPALNCDYLERNYSITTCTYQLTQVVRQALDSTILRNASNLRYRLEKNNYSLPLLRTIKDKNDFIALGVENFEEELSNAYKEYGIDEVICICRSNKVANALNNRIRYMILDRENLIDSQDKLMAVKNNYFWLEKYSKEGFIANGDILKIKKILGFEDRFGYHFADIIATFIDYEEELEIELTILLDTLSLDKASMDNTGEEGLYHKVFAYYYNECGNKIQAKRNTLNDKYFNAVQVKFANALTCHKAQGGGWKAVFVCQNYFTEDMLNKDYLQWLYTAITRAKEKIYMVGFSEDFFKQIE